MRPLRRVAVLIDREQREDGDPELLGEAALRRVPMEHHLSVTLRRFGYEVAIVPCLSARQIVADLGSARPDVVYNATEHFDGCRKNDIQIPALLEMLRIPYTGATAMALLLGRDKAVSKSLARMVGVRVPAFALAPVGVDAPVDVPPFPAVIKPVDGDGSEGVDMTGVVRDRAALAKRLRVFHRRHRRTAIVEEFIPGCDISVFALQDRGLRFLPPVQLCIDADPYSPHSMATYHGKHDRAYRARWKIHARLAELSPKAKRALERNVRRLWPVLQTRDYGRFDFRLTPAEELYFIEANPNPAFNPGGREPFPQEQYEATLQLLVARAARRGGLRSHS